MIRLFPLASRLALAVLLASALSACASDLPDRPPPPQFRFSGLPPISLRAANIVIEDVYLSSGGAPNVEHLYKASPADIVRGWARDRLRLVGTAGQVTVRILDASVIEKPLPTKKGLGGMVKDEQDRKLIGRLQVEITLIAPQGNGRVIAEASATRTLGEHISMNEAEREYYTLLRELANYFDSAMGAEVQSHLAGL